MIEQKQEWEIRARSETCAECGIAFVDGESFMSRLLHGNNGYERSDFCMSCWGKIEDEAAISIWQSVYHSPPPPPSETLKKETAETLLRKLIKENSSVHANTVYILAIMLERRRLLVEKEVQQQADGQKIRLYEYKSTNELFVIPDPGLKLAELQHVQEEVVAMLGGDTTTVIESSETIPATASPSAQS